MSQLSDLFSFLAGTPALVGATLAALILFLTSDWRVSLAALLVQYILVGMALTRSIPVEVAMVKILAGLIVVVILALSAQRLRPTADEEQIRDEGPLFLGLRLGWLRGPLGFPLRVLAVLLVILALLRLFQDYSSTAVPLDIALVACWLGGMGMLGLVLGGEPLRVAAALLTILAGFDLVYSGLPALPAPAGRPAEPSLAVIGFLGAFNVLAALAFSYLAIVRDLHAHSEPGESDP